MIDELWVLPLRLSDVRHVPPPLETIDMDVLERLIADDDRWLPSRRRHEPDGERRTRLEKKVVSLVSVDSVEVRRLTRLDRRWGVGSERRLPRLSVEERRGRRLSAVVRRR